MTRVLQISDTHLGRGKAHFAVNWPPLADWIAAEAPDLVIHTGDISVDGAGEPDDFVYCTEVMANLTAPLLVVPGNHDVGDPFSAAQPASPGRLASWNAYYKTDHWVRDIEGWRLIGFNSMLTSSGLPEELAQLQWIEAQMASADGRRIAWFLHQPLFINDWNEGDTGYWTVRTGPRARLKALADKYRLDLVGTGHVHLSHSMRIGATDFVWCPSAAFTVGPQMQEPLGGEKWLGAVRYDFSRDGVGYELVRLPQLSHLWIDDVVNEVYPPQPVRLPSEEELRVPSRDQKPQQVVRATRCPSRHRYHRQGWRVPDPGRPLRLRQFDLIRIIAGLERQSAGSILVDGKPVDHLRPHERKLAMVFQSYALYPHMSVEDNIAVPLAVQRLTLAERMPLIKHLSPRRRGIMRGISAEVAAVAQQLQIEELLRRKPAQLSGGQRQRVALGRAMVRDPVAFLMDEPLSNLDAKLRVHMRTELTDLHRRLGATFIYVTHDQVEAMTMSDPVAMMGGGRVLQLGSPAELYAHPETLEVARFIGSPMINTIPARIGPNGRVEVMGRALGVATPLPEGSAATIGIRPVWRQEEALPGNLRFRRGFTGSRTSARNFSTTSFLVRRRRLHDRATGSSRR